MRVVGRLEKVRFQLCDTENSEIIAKIDTGADNGAMHCEYIGWNEIDGQRYLEYQPLSKSCQIIQTREYTRVKVKSSNGIVEWRVRIKTMIEIRGEQYPIELTLTDRRDMQYDVIIGYKFLSGRFLVDVSIENV